MTSAKYGLAGTGSCQNVSVDIDEALDGSHYEITIEVASDNTPSHLRFRLESLKQAVTILRFISDHIGNEGFEELELPLTGGTKMLFVKDSEQSDRFFLKFFGAGIFVEQTFGGLSGASLMKALLAAIQDAGAR